MLYVAYNVSLQCHLLFRFNIRQISRSNIFFKTYQNICSGLNPLITLSRNLTFQLLLEPLLILINFVVLNSSLTDVESDLIDNRKGVGIIKDVFLHAGVDAFE